MKQKEERTILSIQGSNDLFYFQAELKLINKLLILEINRFLVGDDNSKPTTIQLPLDWLRFNSFCLIPNTSLDAINSVFFADDSNSIN